MCQSTNTKNQRLRTSTLLRIDGRSYLIDAGPDIRRQALQHHINRIDGLILTHTHYDHVAGLEELRIYNFLQNGPIPCFLSEESLSELKLLFHYIFKDKTNAKHKSNTSAFHFHVAPEAHGTFRLGELTAHYCSYFQAGMQVLGLRFGSLAYITDIKNYSESIFSFLEGIETLVIGAIRFTQSPMHFTIDEAVEFSKKTTATHTYLVHLCHDVEHEHAESLLPKGMHLAYDGLEIPFSL